MSSIEKTLRLLVLAGDAIAVAASYGGKYERGLEQGKGFKGDGPGIMYYKDGTAAEGNFNPSTGFTITKPIGRRPYPTRPARPSDPLNQ